MDRHPPNVPPQASLGISRSRSERSSANSSESGASFENRSVNRQYGGLQLGSRGGYRGNSGSNRTYSGSSGSSNGQYDLNRPVLTPFSTSQRRTTTFTMPDPVPNRTKLSITPAKQQSFILNGHRINETYTISPNTSAKSPRQFTPPSPARANGWQHHSPSSEHTKPVPITRKDENEWAYQQELRIHLLGVPKTCWTKDVYQALSLYGTVVHIEMRKSSSDFTATVTFRSVTLLE